MSSRKLQGPSPVFQALAWARQPTCSLPLPAAVVRVKEESVFPVNLPYLTSPAAVSFFVQTDILFQPCRAGIRGFFDVFQHWKATATVAIRDSSSHGLRMSTCD